MSREQTARSDVVVVPDTAALARAAAERFVQIAREAIESRGQFTVALSGGNTPKAMYAELSGPDFREHVDWEKLQVFFSDERFVPPDSIESNYHTAEEGLLSRVPIPSRYVHRVATVDIEPAEAASIYEEGIRRVFQAADEEIPAFDLIFLGMGPDGHTASLFPGTDALSETAHLVAPNFVPKFDAWRITFTYPLLNAARNVIFLVGGADKAERLAQVLSGGSDLPAAGVHPATGSLTWLVDEAAAVRLGGQH